MAQPVPPTSRPGFPPANLWRCTSKDDLIRCHPRVWLSFEQQRRQQHGRRRGRGREAERGHQQQRKNRRQRVWRRCRALDASQRPRSTRTRADSSQLTCASIPAIIISIASEFLHSKTNRSFSASLSPSSTAAARARHPKAPLPQPPARPRALSGSPCGPKGHGQGEASPRQEVRYVGTFLGAGVRLGVLRRIRRKKMEDAVDEWVRERVAQIEEAIR